MSKTYEIQLAAAGQLYSHFTSAGVKKNVPMDPTQRFQVKKLCTILEQIPEHKTDAKGEHYFGADLDKPVKNAKGEIVPNVYELVKNADGEPITTCRVKIPETIVTGLVWEKFFKLFLESEVSMTLAEQLETYAIGFDLKDTLDKWRESVEPAEEPEAKPEEPAEVK